jgi:hypothetical protein
MAISGTVDTISDAVVIIKCIPVIIFLCVFCRERGGESFYGDGFSKVCLWWWRYNIGDGGWDILKNSLIWK